MAPRTAATAPAVGLRGVLLGLVCGLGAFLAHGLGGGAPVTGPVLVALLTGSVGVGVLLARRALDLEVLVAAALLTQGAHHLTHMVGSGEVAGAGVGVLPMLAGHSAVAIATVALARGADVAIGRLVSRWWSRYFAAPALPHVSAGPRASLPVVVERLVVRRLPRRHLFGRAPPRVTRSVTLAFA